MKKLFLTVLTGSLLVACTQTSEPCPSNDEVVGYNYLVENFPGIEVGNQTDVETWLEYLGHLNDKDLEAMASLEADSIEIYTTDGRLVIGSQTHVDKLSGWIYDTDITWKPVWGLAVKPKGSEGDGSFVMAASDLKVVQEDTVVRMNHMFNAWIDEGKVQAIWIYKREFTQKELNMITAAEAKEEQNEKDTICTYYKLGSRRLSDAGR